MLALISMNIGEAPTAMGTEVATLATLALCVSSSESFIASFVALE